MTELRDIPIQNISFTARNPRSHPQNDLEGLAASLGSAVDPILPQPPLVEDLGAGQYRLLAGERRVRAAQRKGWEQLTCLVSKPLDPLRAHHLRLVENLHRQELHPLDKAAALKITWLAANAKALGLEESAQIVMGQEQTPAQTLTDLTALLSEQGFIPTRPAVTWDTVLNDLGIELHPASRKKLLTVLSIDWHIQEKARNLTLTEAALRSLGQLEPEEQAELVEQIEGTPSLARRVRRISHAVRQHGYTLAEAVAEAQGKITGEDLPLEIEDGSTTDFFEDKTMETVLQLLEAANQATAAITALHTLLAGRDPAELPTPWGEYAVEALEMIRARV